MTSNMYEERVLLVNGKRIKLAYDHDGTVDGLWFEDGNNENMIVIRSSSVPDAPEQIFNLLRECEIEW